MEELKLNSGLKKIAIKDEDGDLITVLRVNVADADTAERFAKIINKVRYAIFIKLVKSELIVESK